MPKEKITSTSKFRANVDNVGVPSGSTVANLDLYDLAVGWNKDGRWVQVNAIPKHWETTGDWTSFDLDADEIDHLIRTLRRAKRQAFSDAHAA